MGTLTRTTISGGSSKTTTKSIFSKGVLAAAIATTLFAGGQSYAEGSGYISPLRFASAYSQIATAFDTMSGTRTHMIQRFPIVIGSGNLKTIAADFYNAAVDTQATILSGNPYTIEKAAIESPVLGISKPLTFGGARSLLVADGSSNILSDELDCSAFGLSKFTRGEKYWVRFELSVTAVGLKFPRGQLSNSFWPTGTAGYYFDPSITTPSPVDGVGALTYTGTAPSTLPIPWAPVIVGRYFDSDPETWIFVGDSIVNGATDTTVTNGVMGFTRRSMWDADGVSNPVSHFNAGKPGGQANAWTTTNSPLVKAYFKYARFGLEEYGTNTFAAGPSGNLSFGKSQSQAIWVAMKAAGIEKVVRTYLLPRTDSTDLWATETNQSGFGGGTNWTAAGDVATFNAWLDTRIGTELDYVIHMNSIRGADPYKWKTDGTANYATDDGTHPKAATYILMANELRAVRAQIMSA